MHKALGSSPSLGRKEERKKGTEFSRDVKRVGEAEKAQRGFVGCSAMSQDGTARQP